MVFIPGRKGKCNDPNLLPRNIKKGVTILGVTGTLEYEDPDLVPGNVRKGVNIFGVTGNYEGVSHIWQQTVSIKSNGITTISPGFKPKAVFGVWREDLYAVDGGLGATGFWGTSDSASLFWQRALFDYDTLGYATTTYEDDPDVLTWGSSGVKIDSSASNVWVGGEYDVIVVG